jgi:hypothetical protein
VIRKRNLASFYIFGYLLELRIESGDLDKEKRKFGNEINLIFCQLKRWPFVEILPEQKKPAHNCSNPSIFCGAMGWAVLYLQHKELDHIHQLQKVQDKEFDPIRQVHKEKISTK